MVLYYCRLPLDGGWGPGWQKYGGRGTLVIQMKSFSMAAEKGREPHRDEMLQPEHVCVYVCVSVSLMHAADSSASALSTTNTRLSARCGDAQINRSLR